MKKSPSHAVNLMFAMLYCSFAVGSACGASALESGSRRSVEDHCVDRTSYVRAKRRDTLDAYASVLQLAGHRTSLTAGGRVYGKSILLVSVRGWALEHDVSFDSDKFTLSPPDKQQRRFAKTAPPLAGGAVSPRTKAGIALGDPFVKVSQLFGNAKWKHHCGLPELAFAGPGQFGDWFAIYRADASGRVVFVQTGDVANGLRHLWH